MELTCSFCPRCSSPCTWPPSKWNNLQLINDWTGACTTITYTTREGDAPVINVSKRKLSRNKHKVPFGVYVSSVRGINKFRNDCKFVDKNAFWWWIFWAPHKFMAFYVTSWCANACGAASQLAPCSFIRYLYFIWIQVQRANSMTKRWRPMERRHR